MAQILKCGLDGPAKEYPDRLIPFAAMAQAAGDFPAVRWSERMWIGWQTGVRGGTGKALRSRRVGAVLGYFQYIMPVFIMPVLVTVGGGCGSEGETPPPDGASVPPEVTSTEPITTAPTSTSPISTETSGPVTATIGGEPSSSPGLETSSPATSPTVTTAPTETPTPTEVPAQAAFPGSELLGSPSLSSIALSLLSELDAEVYVELRTASGHFGQQTAVQTLLANEPLEVPITGLQPDTGYVYRTRHRAPGGGAFLAGAEHRFHTARASGQPFTFTVQADSHLDANSSYELYTIALNNALLDEPDFHLDLGDTFMTEKYSEPFTDVVQRAPDYATVDARYAFERGNFGLLNHSAPLFLINGNHEGEIGWMRTGDGQNVAIWATQARLKYFLNPAPDDFYSGDPQVYQTVGQRRAWYAFTWGDALFVVLDPFWNTEVAPKKSDNWTWTLGQEQYDWLRLTLETSSAPYKFVFAHHLLGGINEETRGGAEAAPYYEWGGLNADGTWGFDTQRPGWGKPIHQLLVENGVSIFFHGHDHLYVMQELEGVVYQEVPQPSNPNYNSGPNLAPEGGYESGVILSTSGHMRVTVAPEAATVEYVRAYRPSDENASRVNRQVSHSYIVYPHQQ